MKKKTLHSGLFFAAVTSTLILYTNCDSNFKPVSGGVFDNSSYSSSCFEDQTTSACLFFKNPFVASSMANGPSTSSGSQSQSHLDSLQNMPIMSSELGSLERLESPDVVVESLVSGPAQSRGGLWKFLFSEDGGASLGRITSYFHISKSLDYAADVLGGSSALSNSNLLVLTEADRTGYSAEDHAIYLQNDPGGHPLSLDAGLTLHLLGEAYLAKASLGAIYDLSRDTHHRACGTATGAVYEADCCVDKNGCSTAISAGQADYWVTMGFSNNPAIGETYARNINGLQHCGLSRNPELNTDLTAAAAFKACEANGRSGQVYAMSLVYSSIWFETRKSLTRLGQDPKEIDRVFLAHLPKLKGSDNFTDALNAIRTTATETGNANLISIFENEFKRRGVD